MSNSHDSLGSIPSYINAPKGVFRDIDHYRAVLAGITKGLVRSKRGRDPTADGSYLFDRIQVEFSPNYIAEEIFLDHLNSKIILRAPQKPRETAQDLSSRRMQYLGQLTREVEAMKAIGITQIYLVLKEDGRKKLERIQKDGASFASNQRIGRKGKRSP